MIDRFKEDLDRHITGNYGQDSVPVEKPVKHKVTLDEVRTALRLLVKNQENLNLKWCVNYAKHALTITSEYDMYVQLLYVLGNMEKWRGQDAKTVRTVLKQFVRENQPK